MYLCRYPQCRAEESQTAGNTLAGSMHRRSHSASSAAHLATVGLLLLSQEPAITSNTSSLFAFTWEHAPNTVIELMTLV